MCVVWGYFLIVQGGRGAPLYLFIYSVVQNDPELLDFGFINNLPFSKKPSTCKNASCLRKGFKVGSYFLESSVMWAFSPQLIEVGYFGGLVMLPEFLLCMVGLGCTFVITCWIRVEAPDGHGRGCYGDYEFFFSSFHCRKGVVVMFIFLKLCLE